MRNTRSLSWRRTAVCSTIGSLCLGLIVACESGDKADVSNDSVGGRDESGADTGSNGDTGTSADSSSGDSDSGRAPGADSDADGEDAGDPWEPGEENCEKTDSSLAVKRLTALRVSELGKPFDTNRADLEGPGSWHTQYGKRPEIIPFTGSSGLDVLFQDQESGDVAYVVHVSGTGSSAQIARAYEVESLGRIMGFTRDASGNYYVASGVDEDGRVNATYPPNEVFRPDIVRIVKFDTAGCVLMESDVDIERGKKDRNAEILVNPMVAGTSRLVWGGDRLLLVHGQNTEPDAGIGGQRHQKAISTILDANSGAVVRTSTMWVSHSFDQRALYNGSSFVELHLGDAYPRAIALGSYSETAGRGAYELFRPKGALGANNTFSRLGSVAQSSNSEYGYLVLFSTERSTTASGSDVVQGTRDLALVRVAADFASKQTSASVIEAGSGTSSQTVNSSGETVTNSVRWLTSLGANQHVERPRLVGIGGDRFVALWEVWSRSGNRDAFQGTYGLILDEKGTVLKEATSLSSTVHLSRGDDAVSWGSSALFVGGDGTKRELLLHRVTAELGFESIALP